MSRVRTILRTGTLLLIGSLIWTPGWAVQDKTFSKAYSSKETFMLTAWGRRYESGVGVPRDPAKAIRLYCKAAKKGDIEAQYQLGQMYAFGRGVKQDKDLAAAWFYKASKKNAKAAGLLGLLKVKGKPKRRASCPLGTGTSIASRPHPATGEIAKLVHSLAPRYSLDPNLVLAVVEAESNFNPKAKSHKNAQGLMQLIPETAERFGVEDVWDPEQNLRGGMAYLRWLLDHFGGDVQLALAGYNAGEKAVERHGGVPPYRETQSYVKRIMHRLGAQLDTESS
jgi:soluble lytic murein transglycosylase-like protein